MTVCILYSFTLLFKTLSDVGENRKQNAAVKDEIWYLIITINTVFRDRLLEYAYTWKPAILPLKVIVNQCKKLHHTRAQSQL